MPRATAPFAVPAVLAALALLVPCQATAGADRCARSIHAELCCMRSMIFSGCCTDDYCPKPAPCIACPCIRSCPDDSCPKPQPCIPCVNVGRCPDNYCPKPLPVVCDPCRPPAVPQAARTSR
ncbi:MAG: hypothetical protein GXY25_22770 [Pirellulaceae bacterium]|jgi:hypothetical protein|nr:hypothetical protein [Thermoguttaceae bacterium]MDI9446806.1 hypothetical protein [Planctomycetota bacterium]NLZ03346.1 hypothetical protein [Pirellulaceae bacterium]